MRKEFKLLVFLFVLAFIIRVIFVFASPIKIWDETVYANLGYDLSSNFLDYSLRDSGWSDYIPGSESFYSWPNMGFRAPLLPYLLSLFYFFKLSFFVNFFVVFVGALSVCLIYILGKNMFNERIGFYSAVFLTLVPLHVIYSARIFTEILVTFFELLVFISFWKGYEKGNKTYKIFFGFFLALSLLSRYTALWIMPVFPIYFLVRDKSFKFLKDKYLWYSILIFFITLIPWFIYGFFTYGNFLGAFIHGWKSSAYWGGLQSWNFFFVNWFRMFSVIGIVFFIGLIYVFYKREFVKKEFSLLLIWFIVFLVFAIYMPHKEQRFILPIVPTIVLISGYFFDILKKNRTLIFGVLVLFSVLHLGFHFGDIYHDFYTDTNECFLQANEFLRGVDSNSVVITDESSVVFYYTKLETSFYPNPWNYETLENWKENYPGRVVYVLFGDYIIKSEGESERIKEDLEKNSEKVWECFKGEGYTLVYQI